MPMKVVLPGDHIKIGKHERFISLIGPTLGSARDWQTDACIELQPHFEDVIVAMSRTYSPNHLLYKLRAPCGQAEPGTHVQWSSRQLDRALEAEDGCAIVWLEAESKDAPRNDGCPYAMCTRDILGEIRGRLIAKPRLHVAFGADPHFSGLRQIKERFEHHHQDKFVFHTTLKETIQYAVRRYF